MAWAARAAYPYLLEVKDCILALQALLQAFEVIIELACRLQDLRSHLNC